MAEAKWRLRCLERLHPRSLTVAAETATEEELEKRREVTGADVVVEKLSAG